MGKDVVFIGIRVGGLPADGDVVVATSLSGLCEDVGLNYNTVKSKEWQGDHLVVRGRDDVKKTKTGDVPLTQIWSLHRCAVRKIEGRGSFRKN